MDAQERLVNRIRAVNYNRAACVELLHCDLDRGAVAFRYVSKRRSAVMRVRIPDVMMPALLGGKKNRNLDNVLRV